MVKINIEEQDGYKVAILDGRLDTPASPEAEKALSPLQKCNDKDIILDCTNLSYIASSGLRIFLDILKNSQAHDHHVYIKNINKNIKEAFVLTGFIDLFEYM